MLDLAYFWMGPLGAMVPLACPSSDVNSTLEVYGDVKQTLYGRRLRDVLGYRRVWDLSNSYIDPTDYSMLETLFTTQQDRVLRFQDPLIANRARLFASLTSNYAGYAQQRSAWSVTAGNAPTFPVTDWPAISYLGAGDGRVASYNGARTALWVPTVAATLNVNGPVTAGVAPLRTVDPARVGEVLTLSAYIRTTGTATVSILLNGVDPAGTVGAGSSSALTASVGVWTRISATYTVAAGQVGTIPRFLTSSTSGTISIAGIMLNSGASALPWVRGGGTSQVIFNELSGSSPRFPLMNMDLSVLEI